MSDEITIDRSVLVTLTGLARRMMDHDGLSASSDVEVFRVVAERLGVTLASLLPDRYACLFSEEEHVWNIWVWNFDDTESRACRSCGLTESRTRVGSPAEVVESWLKGGLL